MEGRRTRKSLDKRRAAEAPAWLASTVEGPPDSPPGDSEARRRRRTPPWMESAGDAGGVTRCNWVARMLHATACQVVAATAPGESALYSDVNSCLTDSCSGRHKRSESAGRNATVALPDGRRRCRRRQGSGGCKQHIQSAGGRWRGWQQEAGHPAAGSGGCRAGHTAKRRQPRCRSGRSRAEDGPGERAEGGRKCCAALRRVTRQYPAAVLQAPRSASQQAAARLSLASSSAHLCHWAASLRLTF